MIRAVALKVVRRLMLKRAALRSWWLGIRVRWFWAAPWGGQLHKLQAQIADKDAQIGALNAAKVAAETSRDWERRGRKDLEARLQEMAAQRMPDSKLMPIVAALLWKDSGRCEITLQSLEEISHSMRVKIEQDNVNSTIRLALVRDDSGRGRRPPDKGGRSFDPVPRSDFYDRFAEPWISPDRWDEPKSGAISPEAVAAFIKGSQGRDRQDGRPDLSSERALQDRKPRYLEDAFTAAQDKVNNAVDRALKQAAQQLDDDIRRGRAT